MFGVDGGGHNFTMPLQFHPEALFRLAVPILLLVGGLMLRPEMLGLEGEPRVLLGYLPYVICAVVLIASHLFSRLRFLLAVVLVAGSFWLVQSKLQVSLSEPDAARVYLQLTVTVPLVLLYLLLIPERGIWNLQGVLAVVALGLVVAALMSVATWLPQAEQGGIMSFAARPVEGYVMSWGATCLTALVGVAGLVLLMLRNGEEEAALLCCLGALYLMLAQLHLELVSVMMSAAAGLGLLYGLLRSTHNMAYRDDLTGLLGRRALNERLKRLGRRYAIAMADVDHFKRFNDTHGHDVGDEVLKLVASRLNRVGGGGTAYRYGGEEFCIVFPRRTAAECVEHLDAVRQDIAGYEMSLRDRKQRPRQSREGTRKRGASRVSRDHVSVTVSMGVAERSEKAVDAEAVLKAADARLYAAKKGGRNRVTA